MTHPPVGCQRCEWTPTDRHGWATHGALACAWIEAKCICGPGEYQGRLMRIRKDQAEFLFDWYEYCPSCGQWRYNEGLKGAATGDGKTGLISGMAAIDLAGPEEIATPGANVVVAAASFKQARLLFANCMAIFGGRDGEFRNAPLRGMCDVYENKIEFRDGSPGTIERVAAVAGTNEGGIPSLFLGDEMHEWGDWDPASEESRNRKARLYTVIGKSTLKRGGNSLRGGGRSMMLSTAGARKDGTLLGEVYKRGQLALDQPHEDPRFYMNWRQARDGLDYENPDDRLIAVKDASGAADVLWSAKDRVASYGKPQFPKHEWIRYFANRWGGPPSSSWLKDHPMAWQECQGEWDTSDSNPFVLAVDMALRHDSAAVVRVELLPDGRMATTAHITLARGGVIDHRDVIDHIKTQAKGSGFRGVVYDPRFFELAARELEDQNILTIEFSQDPQKMAPACGETYERIASRRIVHAGQQLFTSHVIAAVMRQQERGFTLAKGKSKQHIDACVAMCMGVWVLMTFEERRPLF